MKTSKIFFCLIIVIVVCLGLKTCHERCSYRGQFLVCPEQNYIDWG